MTGVIWPNIESGYIVTAIILVVIAVMMAVGSYDDYKLMSRWDDDEEL